MKIILFASLLALAFTDAAPLEKRDTVQGFDISHYQGTVNFKGAYSSGARFVIIKVGKLPHVQTIRTHWANRTVWQLSDQEDRPQRGRRTPTQTSPAITAEQQAPA